MDWFNRLSAQLTAFTGVLAHVGMGWFNRLSTQWAAFTRVLAHIAAFIGVLRCVPGWVWVLLVFVIFSGGAHIAAGDSYHVLAAGRRFWETLDPTGDVWREASRTARRRCRLTLLGLTGATGALAWAMPLSFPLPILCLTAACLMTAERLVTWLGGNRADARQYPSRMPYEDEDDTAADGDKPAGHPGRPNKTKRQRGRRR